ncbi:endonuclease/exonuclease/phosphatase family protein [uncultured Arcticibacterium sp.]|uniref:endonuclease/exonuclease/phosphatase family protein n=1 Tax=uncultured Arcticibacterium sp. TaxID=2173042 RepID=UPI0030FC1161
MFSYIFAKSWKFILSLLILVAGFPLIERTIKFNFPKEQQTGLPKLSVLSYNVMYCDNARANTEEGKAVSLSLINDMDTLTADIKCFQELYNKPKDSVFDVFSRLKRHTPYFTYMHSDIDESSKVGSVGLAIFSKYPIIHKEEISWKTNNNGLLLADIVVKKDTIRVFNVQMKSMGIRVAKAITRNEVVRNKEAKNILSQLKLGFKDRGFQVDELEELIKVSPYPVIVAGDFNEMPYGYAYGRVRKQLENSFEDSGYGFGFTYHKMPSFLRIDNIFYKEDKFQIQGFETYRDLENSDHYPIRASYGIKPS